MQATSRYTASQLVPLPLTISSETMFASLIPKGIKVARAKQGIMASTPSRAGLYCKG